MADTKTNRMSKADRPEESDDFPRMVYRYSPNGVVMGAGFKADGSTHPGAPCDNIIVGNPAALQNALDHGWHLDPWQAAQAHDEEEEQRMKRREGKGGKDSDRPRDKNFRDIDQHSGTADYSETTDNPRPNEPDNAPFQNTPYVEPQTGDLADPPTSPPDRPVIEPIPPEDADTLKAPGEAEDEALKRQAKEGVGPRPTQMPASGPGEKLPDRGDNKSQGGGLTGDKDNRDKGGPSGARETGKDDRSDRDKGAPSKAPGRPKGS